MILQLKRIILAVSILVFSGVGYAAADDNGSHKYCPRGASLYFFVFAYWCEDGVYAGVQPFDCKSGPGQAVGSWNNSSVSAEQICTQQSNGMVASQMKTSN